MKNFLLALALFITDLVFADTNVFVNDQQVARIGEGALCITCGYGPLGQSFTPQLSRIRFVRIYFFDPNSSHSTSGATVLVNLRFNSITGPIMGSTTAQYMPTGFNGFVSFFFTNDIVLLPGVKHYLEPVHIFGTDNWSVAYASMNLAQYAGGGLITYGTESIYSDMWFREGVLLTPSAEAPVRNSNGTVSIKFTSAPGSTNYTQVATNFVNPVWVNVATNILGTNVLVTNSYTWSYTNFATNGPTRYYRSYTLPQ